MLSKAVEDLIRLAIAEDLGSGDLTTEALIAPDLRARGEILAKERLVVCGQETAGAVFALIDPGLEFSIFHQDGQEVLPGTVISQVQGSCRSILSAERTALNFLQRLCGISTLTRRIVAQAAGTCARVLDTRKTTPGLRELEKYAVKTGGGANHRFGLFDAVLIKNNHIDAAQGRVAEAIERCRQFSPRGTKIEVEVRSVAELEESLASSPDAILLDNMTPTEVRCAVETVRQLSREKRIEVEVSGGITEENIRAFAECGVDSISLGALTHSVRAMDLSLRCVVEHG